MRVAVFIEEDLTGCLVLNELLPQLSGHEVAIFLARKDVVLPDDVPREYRELLAVQWQLPTRVIFPLLDARQGGGGEPNTFRGLARQHGVPLHLVTGMQLEFLELVRSFAPEVGVAARFSFILPADALKMFPLGCLNVHPGALPEYAGLHAPLHALADGAAKITSTVVRIDQGIDTGEIVACGHLDVRPDRSLLWHIARSYRPGIDLLPPLITELQRGQALVTHPQDQSLRRYRRYLPAPEIRRLADRYGLFQWREYAAITRVLSDREIWPEGWLSDGDPMELLEAWEGGMRLA